MTDKIEKLEQQLDSFDSAQRQSALAELVSLVAGGQITLPEPSQYVNLHGHTFYSYNAYGYSPSKYAWLARKEGLAAAGTVDFDVLDSLEEFLAAARMLGLKGAVGIETRVYVPEFAEREMSSPGEPGITYHMGVGFPSSKLSGSGAIFLADLRQMAQQRNISLMERVNDYLDLVRLDNEKDIMPLTPAGNPTERHLCLAYARKAQEVFSDTVELAKFWTEKLGTDATKLTLPEGGDLINAIRAKTMKQGGVGYVQPGEGSFPQMAEMNEFILAAGGIPTLAWLNGLSNGEQVIEELLDVAMNSGTAAINIIPDRNFTPGVKDKKLENLNQVIAIAQERNLPIIVGTEMNSPGQKFRDNFEAAELAVHVPVFLRGANIVYGHSVLQQQSLLGYTSKWASERLPDLKQRNDFYESVGVKLNPQNESVLAGIDSDTEPKNILAKLA